jgi:hypothetical protein
MPLSPTEKYLFDTLGFLVIPGVLCAEEICAINNGIDLHRSTDFHERTNSLRNSAHGLSGRLDCGNFLSWPSSDGGDILRSILHHPKLAPILNEICGQGHRLDHKPLLFIQPHGAEGFDLHGGAVTPDGHFNYPISYHCHYNQIVCSLVNVAVQLSDSPQGAGGFVVIPGSHKSNFPYAVPDLSAIADTYGYQPVCKAGDVILFSEAVLHGAMVRNAPSERRVVLMRFSPPTCAFARGYLQPHDFLDLLTPAQRAVAAVPYHLDQDRPTPTAAGEDSVHVPRPRKEEKRNFDHVVFGHEYY